MILSYSVFQLVKTFKEKVGLVHNEFHIDFVLIESFVEDNIKRVTPFFIHKLSKKASTVKVI